MEAMSTVPTSVIGALESVSRWRIDTEARHKAELEEVDQEVQSLEQSIQNLQQQLEALQKFRGELVERSTRIDEEETQRTYAAIFGALGHQVEDLQARAAKVAEAEAAGAAALADAMKDSATAPLLKEYEQFKTQIEPTLSSLPESYRSVILQHHEGVVAKLREHLAQAGTAPVQVEGDPVSVDLVFAVDAPEGAVELVMLVLPVQEETYTGWHARGEDLQTWFAARVVQALYQAAATLGQPAAQAMFGGHQGLLAIEMEIGGGNPEEVAETLEAAFAAAVAAPELQAAGVTVQPRRVSVDHLLPPEEDEDDA